MLKKKAMAFLSVTRHVKQLFCCTVMMMLSFLGSGLEFRVGGYRGWIEPTGNDTDLYNQWASQNRFHVGDSLYFEYKNDSVLVVDGDDYGRCNGTFPMYKFKDGHTLFTFDRYGFFYFISGNFTHCRHGQRLIVRVMHHQQPSSPAPQGGSTAPQTGGGGGCGATPSGPTAPPSSSSTTRLTASSFPSLEVIALGGVMMFYF